jgi:hypothetical protein
MRETQSAIKIHGSVVTKEIKGIKQFQPSMVLNTYNPITWMMRQEDPPVQGQPGLRDETLSQKKKKSTSKNM